jgi:hypothetical protein
MPNSLTLRVTHSGTTNASIYINDIHDGKDQNGRVYNRKPPQYVPVGGYVDLLFTEQVHYSYEQGTLRSFITQGLVTTEFIGVIAGALEVVHGTELWNFDPFQNTVEAGNADDWGVRFNSKTTDGHIDMFYYDDFNALFLVAHQPTSGVSDDADFYVYTSKGILNDDGTSSGGDIEIYTGQGYGSTIEDENGTSGGDVNFNTGKGGDFGGEGGVFTVTTGKGGDGEDNGVLDVSGQNGGTISLNTGDGGANGGNGGNIELITGSGDGAGATSGNIILDPGTGQNGADNGQVVIYNEVRLGDYANGIATVTNGNGLIQTKGGSGQVTQAINAGQVNTTFVVTVNDAIIQANSIVVFTVEVSHNDVSITSPVYIRNKVNGSLEAVFNALNNDGNARNMYLNYIVL